MPCIPIPSLPIPSLPVPLKIGIPLPTLPAFTLPNICCLTPNIPTITIPISLPPLVVNPAVVTAIRVAMQLLETYLESLVPRCARE